MIPTTKLYQSKMPHGVHIHKAERCHDSAATTAKYHLTLSLTVPSLYNFLGQMTHQFSHTVSHTERNFRDNQDGKVTFA